MSGKDCILDTNIVIGLFANESSITEKIKSLSHNIFIPTIVLGELFYGAEQSTRKEENRKKIEEFAEVSLVLECDTDTAPYYGKIKSNLKTQGTPIPENDIWIAALAQQHQLTLVTKISTSNILKPYRLNHGNPFRLPPCNPNRLEP